MFRYRVLVGTAKWTLWPVRQTLTREREVKWYLKKQLYLCLMLPAVIGGCVLMKNETPKHSSGGLYFSTPEEAVPKITELLRNEDFVTLAKCYDLSNSDIPLSDLESGDFFIRTVRPEMSHPAGFWRYKHPFSPGFEYSSTRPSTRESVYIVEVRIVIDQGVDSPEQEGFSLFYMIKSVRGWQVLPEQVADNGEPELPLSID